MQPRGWKVNSAILPGLLHPRAQWCIWCCLYQAVLLRFLSCFCIWRWILGNGSPPSDWTLPVFLLHIVHGSSCKVTDRLIERALAGKVCTVPEIWQVLTTQKSTLSVHCSYEQETDNTKLQGHQFVIKDAAKEFSTMPQRKWTNENWRCTQIKNNENNYLNFYPVLQYPGAVWPRHLSILQKRWIL